MNQVELFKALSNPIRLQILTWLKDPLPIFLLRVSYPRREPASRTLSVLEASKKSWAFPNRLFPITSI